MQDYKKNTEKENQNFTAFRKAMSLMNVTVYPEMMVYTLPTPKVADSVLFLADRLIKKNGWPLAATRPGATSNTVVITEVTPEYADLNRMDNNFGYAQIKLTELMATLNA